MEKQLPLLAGVQLDCQLLENWHDLGYKVTIFEAEEKAGGLNTYGIVSFPTSTDDFLLGSGTS